MRAELFKIYYLESLFDLNTKADASEAMTCILKLIHSLFIDSNARKMCKTFEDELDLNCNRDCFVHELINLQIATVMECKCGKTKNIQDHY